MATRSQDVRAGSKTDISRPWGYVRSSPEREPQSGHPECRLRANRVRAASQRCNTTTAIRSPRLPRRAAWDWMVKPMDFAPLRLTTNSNLVGVRSGARRAPPPSRFYRCKLKRVEQVCCVSAIAHQTAIPHKVRRVIHRRDAALLRRFCRPGSIGEHVAAHGAMSSWSGRPL